MVRCPTSIYRQFTALFCSALLALAGAARAQVSVLTQHNDNLRDGVNASETTLTPANVNANQFGLLFKLAVDDQVYAQPLVDSSVSINGSTHSVVYVATTNNSVYAFDANTGAPFWHRNLGTALKVSDIGFSCTDVLNTTGIMSTPVINPSANTIYVVDETYTNGSAGHYIHALNLATGAEQPGSPVHILASEFDSKYAIQRPGLLLANGNVYFSFASHCDNGNWKGFTMAYSAASLAQVGLFNPAPNDNGNGIWQSGNGDAADAQGYIYWVTGNGTWDGVNNFSESMMKGTPNLGLADWYTPSKPADLDSVDSDLTSSGPLLLANTNLMVAGGKQGVLNLVNTGSMGHLGGAVQTWQANNSHLHSLVYFNSNLYVWGQGDYLKVYKFNGSTFNPTPSYKGSVQAIGHPGGTLSISASGTSNGILWATTNLAGADGGDAWHSTQPGILYAFSLPSMTQLWTNRQNATRDTCNNYAKFTPPTIANGKVYLASFGTAQTSSGQVCVYGAVSSNSLIGDGTYIVKSLYSGQAIDDPASSTAYSTVMTQYTVNNGNNQRWNLHNLGNNVVTLTNVASGLVLEVTGGSKSNSALVDQYPYQGNPWQQWRVVSLGGGTFELTSVNSGEALDVDGGGTTAGEMLDQYPYQGNPWEQWTFTAQ